MAQLLCSVTEQNVEWHLLVTTDAAKHCNQFNILTATNMV